MPRLAREKSNSGIYHIILRGRTGRAIFRDDEDNLMFLKKLGRCGRELKVQIYAWCLMIDHLHLLIKRGEEELSDTMKRLAVSYAGHYNRKYKSMGHVFYGRYQSENIETDEYLLTVARYIHQNPVNAGIASTPSEWKWSSCGEYYGEEACPAGLLDIKPLLKTFSEDEAAASQDFRKFNEARNQDSCMDCNSSVKLTDDQARAHITSLAPEMDIGEIRNLPKGIRNEIIMKIKKIDGLSQRQAARILGLSQTLISMVQ
ncbi:REP element-mobilizing transposase RayT [Anaerobacterium chartisolvens]|uniref:REP element-mobilizing transposase RayT n=1 Tax=Anaerobacterium chartisolvens TaxID=1297424 RepID=A0A369BDY8_9FIRM|nr:transposase [Anaerobacterium chartisolvens]RCX17884.1 REP element-mobilizing transposase RayT [Anaerobacterium chartisolvens]